MIPNGARVMIGGFMGSRHAGTADRRTRAAREVGAHRHRQRHRLPGKGIGKLVDAGLVRR